MENKQTAVDYLIEKLDNNLDINHSWRTRQYIEQAKAIEKEQIKDAWINGNDGLSDFNVYESEKYYNETYGKD